MVDFAVQRIPDFPAPDEREIEVFFEELGGVARRYMPLEASDVLGSNFLAWTREGSRITGVAGCVRRKGLQFLHIATAEDMRGRGLGRALLQEVLAFGRRQGASIYLSVHTENQPAVELYRRHGFGIVAREPGRYWMMCPTTRGGAALYRILRVLTPLLSLGARIRASRRSGHQ